MKPAIRITVLRGGISAEREISLAGGAAVARACRRLGYRVVEADIAPDNLAALDESADVIFPVLHGRFGEDGRLQAILEARGIPYVGSDAAASRLAMDKHAAKLCWRAAGLPTPEWMVIGCNSPRPLAGEGGEERGEEASDTAESARTANCPHPNPLPKGEGTSKGPHPNPLPMGEGTNISLSCKRERRELLSSSQLIVKPISEGSSIGVVPCDSAEYLPRILPHVTHCHGSAMLERRLDGPELTVGILGEQALPAIEIQPHRNSGGLFDYQAKYQNRETVFSFDPQLDAASVRSAQEAALAAFHALGCRDYGRVDIIVDRHAGPQLLEINTIPGFTTRSLLPKAAMQTGMDFEQLVGELVGGALCRGAHGGS